jgi:hypothetical protein
VAPVTIYRIVDGGERFNRVIVPPHALWEAVNSTVP